MSKTQTTPAARIANQMMRNLARACRIYTAGLGDGLGEQEAVAAAVAETGVPASLIRATFDSVLDEMVA